jgi:hypothetical protein
MDPHRRLGSAEVLQHKYFTNNGWSEEYSIKLKALVEAHNAKLQIKSSTTPNAANLSGAATTSTLTVQSNPTSNAPNAAKNEPAPATSNSRSSSSNRSAKGGKSNETETNMAQININPTTKKDSQTETTAAPPANGKANTNNKISKSVLNVYGQSNTPSFNANFDDLIISNSISNNTNGSETVNVSTISNPNNSNNNNTSTNHQANNSNKMKLTFLNSNSELKPAISLNPNNMNDPNAKKNNKLVSILFLF